MLFEHQEGNALRQGICHVVRPGHLVELQHTIVHQLPHAVNAGVDVTAPLPVDWIVRHHDAGCIILPHTGLTLLLQPPSLQQGQQVTWHHLHRALRRRHKLCLTGAESDAPLPLRLPRQGHSVETHHVTRPRLVCVGVGSEISIHPPLQHVTTPRIQAAVRQPLVVRPHDVLKGPLSGTHVRHSRVGHELRKLSVGESQIRSGAGHQERDVPHIPRYLRCSYGSNCCSESALLSLVPGSSCVLTGVHPHMPYALSTCSA
eukprot:1777181-Rhodomonas_salina.1